MSSPIENAVDMQALPALSTGALALELLGSGPRGIVVAKFENSLYVRFASGVFICVGAQAIGNAPLNILLADAHWWLVSAGLLEEKVAAHENSVDFGCRARVALAGATRWQPRQSQGQRERMLKGLPALDAVARHIAPEMGLSRLAFAPASGSDVAPLFAFARPAWDALERWLVRCAVTPLENDSPAPVVSRLIGLGPGLTPSGDDVFCGVLIALKFLGLDGPAATLWSWLQSQIEQRTSALSAAHLRAAALGHGHEALHLVLECMPDHAAALDAALRGLGRIGHSSGWDALAGVALVSRVYAARVETSRVASSAA